MLQIGFKQTWCFLSAFFPPFPCNASPVLLRTPHVGLFVTNHANVGHIYKLFIFDSQRLVNYTISIPLYQRAFAMELVYWIIAFTIAITFHEAAHAWMADRLGDPTPRLMGRLSLNPLVHYDPIGTTLLIVMVVIGSPFPFGWAKPVQFDPYNLKSPRRDSALISLAGPATNVILAVIASLILHAIPFSEFSILLATILTLNLVLALFNLIPIHPLDGGKIFIGLLPEDQARDADHFLHRYGMILLFFLIIPWNGASPLSTVFSPIMRFLLNILLP